MAQASSAQREPSMEEILASIRRIIEDNDAGRRQAEPEQGQARAAAPVAASAAAPAPNERTVIEVDAFRNELRTVETSAPAREAPQQKRPVTLAEVQAQITAEAAAMPSRWMDPEPAKPVVTERPVSERLVSERPLAERSIAERQPYERSPDDIKKAIENSRAAREEARALLGIPEAANTARPPEQHRSDPAPIREAAVEERPAIVTQSRPALAESIAAKPALLSERVERQVAASFSELSEAFAVRSQKRFDEMAQEMIEPLLRDWMENNLPTLVERLVREEIERVARGAQ
jgi:cell pole-organizing protein PopZ